MPMKAYDTIARRDGKGEWGTTGKPKVVLSFGARMPGGATFAQWLRLQIMQRKGYKKPNHVYLDTIALQAKPDVNLHIGWFSTSGKKLGGMDTYDTKAKKKVNEDAFVPQDARAGGVASWHDDWDIEYVQAVRSAHTMVFVLTPAWLESPNCIEELRTYVRVFSDPMTRVTGGKERQGLVLHFSRDPDLGGEKIWYDFLKEAYAVGAGPQASRALQQLKVDREFTVKDPRQRATLTGNMANQWTLTPESLNALLAAMHPYKGEP
jgi:hypothetical protein